MVVQRNRTDLTSRRSWHRSRRRCPEDSPGSATVRPGSALRHTYHTGGRGGGGGERGKEEGEKEVDEKEK